ncbi:DUF305 domain-containing protein [Phytomonospora sp. NPDC050363]|uniref:DUF305 domain-containing protein n=1 Tax=Phytomonospora sp. NPDC050363 TaxID=3155642 RepID=UPI0033DDF87C
MRQHLRQRPLITLGLAVALALALGLAIGVTIARPASPGDDSAEAGFARDMIVHHSQAVNMGMMEYRNGEDPDTRRFGYDIGLTQQAQIGIMKTWLSDWGLNPTTTEPAMGWMDGEMTLVDGRMPGMASPEDIERLDAARGKDSDILFAQLMIQHHLGGVHMADAVLDRSDDPRVTHLAEVMKNGQQSEIAALRDKLTALGAPAT